MNLKTEILNYVVGKSQLTFDDLAFELYKLQSKHNSVYRKFLRIIDKASFSPASINEIPLMPISLFKHQIIKTKDWNEEALFLSSGTTESESRSKHYVKDLQFYNTISSQIFSLFYNSERYKIIALLPSYLENNNSSLVQMTKHLMQIYKSVDNFYLYNLDDLNLALTKRTNKKIILLGVTFALIDFASKYKIDNDQLNIIFTGGMKNRKRELSFDETFEILRKSFPVSSIGAEYGMTEMFSQSYSINDKRGYYIPGPTLKIISKEINDPFQNRQFNKTGQLGFIDLANIDTLSFVLTDDLCIQNSDGKFKLLGRLSSSDLRGCTLLYNP